MSRCIELAKNGLGSTYPNPLVGAVIVHNEAIIGEGWHHKAGQPHAEVNAINSVKDISVLKEATMYVSLEPCSHFGKTPPCADLLIEKEIKRVVIGSTDPNPKVSGKGIKKLIESGCDVVVGVLEKKCNELNKRFFTYHTKQRPYIILKWAQTLDGFIAPQPALRSKKEPVWITTQETRQWVHKTRSEEQAILVGTQTVLEDNPSLTTRDWHGTSPVRVIIDKQLKIPESASVLDGKVKTILISEIEKKSTNNLMYETIDFSLKSTEQICTILHKHKLQSVIIEGGAITLQHFINDNLWDEAHVYVGSTTFGEGISAPKLKGTEISTRLINNDVLKMYKNKTL